MRRVHDDRAMELSIQRIVAETNLAVMANAPSPSVTRSAIGSP